MPHRHGAFSGCSRADAVHETPPPYSPSGANDFDLSWSVTSLDLVLDLVFLLPFAEVTQGGRLEPGLGLEPGRVHNFPEPDVV